MFVISFHTAVFGGKPSKGGLRWEAIQISYYYDTIFLIHVSHNYEMLCKLRVYMFTENPSASLTGAVYI